MGVGSERVKGGVRRIIGKKVFLSLEEERVVKLVCVVVGWPKRYFDLSEIRTCWPPSSPRRRCLACSCSCWENAHSPWVPWALGFLDTLADERVCDDR